MMLKNLAFFVVFCALFSCVKDTDFDQANAIALTPVYELDLVYFTVDAPDFEFSGELGGAYRVTDTTDVRFLDDSFTVDVLKRAEVYFRINNSIPRTFNTQIDFLNTGNEVRYSFAIPVQAGSVTTPVLTEHIQVVDTEADITALTSSDKVVVTVSVPESTQELEGSLNLQSKTTYFVEY